jgi:hypothetical protein
MPNGLATPGKSFPPLSEPMLDSSEEIVSKQYGVGRMDNMDRSDGKI